MAHTKELYASNEGGNWRVMAADENGGYTVADMHADDQEANAKLFTGAPELLSVALELDECAAYWSEYDVPIGIHDRLKAAIAKALADNYGNEGPSTEGAKVQPQRGDLD